MKKYLSLFVLLGVILATHTAQAVETSTSSEVSGTMTTEVELTPAQKRAEMQAEMEARAKLGKDEARKEGQDDKGALGNNELEDRMEMNRTEMKNEVKSDLKVEIDSIRAQAKTKLEEIRNKITAEKDKTKAKIKEDRLTSRKAVVMNFEKVSASLAEKETALKSQIARAKSIGVDVTQAEKNLVTFDAKLAEIKVKTTEAFTFIATLSVDKKLSDADKAKLKQSADSIQTLLKEAREALKTSMTSLRDAVKSYKASLQVSGNTSTNTNVND